MSKPPAFQFYADDFLAGTLDMSQEEVGIYIKLLCFQWSRGGLPNDMARLAMLVRTNNEPNNEAALRYVLDAKFVVCQDGQLRNSRMEEVRKQTEKWHEKSVSGGKASGNKRLGDSDWGKRMAKQRASKRTNNEPNNEAAHEPTTNSPSPSPSPINNKRKKHTGEHPCFPSWYAIYPLKKARGQAVKAYTKAIALLEAEHGDGACQFLEDRTRAAVPELLAKGEFIPYPATWLNSQRWDDQPAPTASQSRILTPEEQAAWRPT